MLVTFNEYEEAMLRMSAALNGMRYDQLLRHFMHQWSLTYAANELRHYAQAGPWADILREVI